MRKSELLRAIAQGRYSHLHWARRQEYRRRHGLPPAEYVGGATHHRRWVKIYDALEAVLKRNRGSGRRK